MIGRERPLFYVLKDKEPVPCKNALEWADLMIESEEIKRVASDKIEGVKVSTVFLGIDRAIFGPPVLFETMVFGGVLDREKQWYCTWEEAKKGHEEMCELVRKKNDEKD